MRALLFFAVVMGLGACASLQQRDPLNIDVAGIEPLPSEGMEVRLAITIRIQNPNDTQFEFTGTALELDLNGRALASGVSSTRGKVPRYGETKLTVPVTISAFNVIRQLIGLMDESDENQVNYLVRGKLEAGLIGTQRFTDEGSFRLHLPAQTR